MAVLRTDYERSRLFKSGGLYGWEIINTISAWFAVLGITAGFIICAGAATASGANTQQDTAQSHRVALVQYINHTNPAFRAQEAKELIKLDDTGAVDVYGNASWNDRSSAEVTSALKHVAATGDEMRLTAPVSPWHSWRVLASMTGIIAFLAWGVISFLFYLFKESYSSEGSEYSRFLVDMPYRQVWPVVFIATWVVGWPFFAISALRYHKAKRAVKPAKS